MTLTQTIQQHLANFPPDKQAEVLDFVLFLEQKLQTALKTPATDKVALPNVRFWQTTPLEALIRQQGVHPVEDLRDVACDFWPEDESIDDFLRFNAQQRRDDREAQ